jgi:two-component system NarL family sensor kinase
MQVEGSLIRAEKQTELIIFRIVQETFNNIIKHAEATTLHVTIHYHSSGLELLITDNGKGVNLTPLNEGQNNGFGLGIRNMHNRAKLIGAEFTMNSTLGKGTTVKIVLPIDTNNHENRQ